MFNHIMAPVDLAHIDTLKRALEVTADAARHYGAKVTFVSATTALPGAIAHTPDEFRQKLADFAETQGRQNAYEASSHALVLHDQAVDLDHALLKAVGVIGADLVIMASHKPSIADYFWSSNGGAVAEHADCSVMIVREA
ncbi:Nucleotide-binding universal stress protein, UspA family [Roseivivax lentus]|uniref:Nucleotide-binding universal stress protein, UspA family n=1 Tax=Roseivivax lentus TaxID=633194 RepID=A0A1N7L1H9_9RHOB|nr:universal stress protein [Roseivivax lentus]SIS67723.1 Nucleotide-binding universal stress protein, UspA family [Roseivivax lentus]